MAPCSLFRSIILTTAHILSFKPATLPQTWWPAQALVGWCNLKLQAGCKLVSIPGVSLSSTASVEWLVSVPSYSLVLLESLVLVVTFLSCCTRGLRSLPAFSLCLCLLFRLGGAVWEKPRGGGVALPSLRYSNSISPLWWACSSEISFKCLGGGEREER